MRRAVTFAAPMLAAVFVGVALGSTSAASPATQNQKPLVIIELYGRSV